MNIIKPYEFITTEKIESLANGILDEVNSNRRRPLKDYDVAEAVGDYLDLSILWTPIEPDTNGEIAAMIIPIEQKILINEDVLFLTDPKYSKTAKEGFKNSTLAHEIGHWILHVDQNAVSTYIDQVKKGNLLEEIEPFLCRTVTFAQGIEWQAQYFASCLLMPVSKLIEAKKGRDLTKWNHLYAIADELGVTISNLLNRLSTLNWIIHTKGSKQIYLGKNCPNV